MAHEDLDFNPFYRALQKSYATLYEKAQDNGWLVVIPHSSSVRGITLSQAFTEMHILKPSPYFQDQYIANCKLGEFGFSIEDSVMRTESGFESAFSVKVLYEELAYSKDYKPFRILVTDRPLIPEYRSSLPDTDADIGISISRLLQERVLLNDHTRLLKSLPSYDKIMIALDSALVQFNNNYMVVDGYLEHTAKKLDQLSAQGVETVYTYIPGMRKLAVQDSRVGDSIRLAVESYIMGWVHQKVFRAVAKMKGDEDEDLFTRCKLCAGLSPESLGVSEEFCCALPEAMVELTALDSFTTPLEKLNCLKNTLELITNGVQRHISNGMLVTGSDTPTPNLVSDDLIPILVTVIIQAKCNRLPSNLYYVENFHWASSSKANLGYSLVTFQAATEYLLTTDMKHLVPATVEEDTTQDNPMAAAVAAASKGRVLVQVKHTGSNMDNLRRAWASMDAGNRTSPPSHDPAANTSVSLDGARTTRVPGAEERDSVSSMRRGTTVGIGGRTSPLTRGTLWRSNTWTVSSQQSVTDELAEAGVIPASEAQRSRTPSRSPIAPKESKPMTRSAATRTRRAEAGTTARQPSSRGSSVGHWIDGMTEKLS